MALTEIERKFLLTGDFRPEVYNSTHIVQGYISRVPGRIVRIRIRDDKAYLTIKGPTDGITRFEWEKEIPFSEGMELLKLCGGEVIDKTRHLVRNSDGRHIWEIDEFHGANEGLVVAEIELGSPDEPFDKPSWVGEEVSQDPRYYNYALLCNPYSSWKDK